MYEKKEVLTVLCIIEINRKSVLTRLVVDSILCQQDLIICSGNVLFRFVA